MTTSITFTGPTAKEKKYDRQLRLWGANGQAFLENSHICLVNATATGAETLKNLVLPGIGRFTIVDDAIVQESDLGVNFFLDESCMGQPRAKCCSRLLEELNPDVQGGYIVGSLPSLLTYDPTFITTTHVTHLLLLSPIPTPLVESIQSNHPTLPIFHAYSLGFISSLRISLPEITIVETHPDSLVDIRLANPWHELLEVSEEQTKDIDSMSDHKHGHIPYVCLLLHYLEIWKREHSGSLPLSRTQRREFATKVKNGMRTNVPGASEENFEEAVAAIPMFMKPYEIYPETQRILKDPCAENLTSESSSFWVIAKAVNMFVEDPSQGNGLLPLSGSLPDMKAESEDYVRLQNVYRAKSLSDASMVRLNADELLAELGRAKEDISDEEINLWCRHANYVRCLRWRNLSNEFASDAFHAHAIYSEVTNNPESLAPIYIAIRSYQQFIDDQYISRESAASSQEPPSLSTLARPGEDENTEHAESTLIRYASQYLEIVYRTVRPNAAGEECESWVADVAQNVYPWLKEVVRYGGGELHNIASLTGGLAAQEIIKIITKQYIPANNTILFDGVKSRSQVIEV